MQHMQCASNEGSLRPPSILNPLHAMHTLASAASCVPAKWHRHLSAPHPAPQAPPPGMAGPSHPQAAMQACGLPPDGRGEACTAYGGRSRRPVDRAALARSWPSRPRTTAHSKSWGQLLLFGGWNIWDAIS